MRMKIREPRPHTCSGSIQYHAMPLMPLPRPQSHAPAAHRSGVARSVTGSAGRQPPHRRRRAPAQPTPTTPRVSLSITTDNSDDSQQNARGNARGLRRDTRSATRAKHAVCAHHGSQKNAHHGGRRHDARSRLCSDLHGPGPSILSARPPGCHVSAFRTHPAPAAAAKPQPVAVPAPT
eukprot:COSAG06_NODE_6135_length_3068_cov_360.645722_2_plen_178_part_00